MDSQLTTFAVDDAVIVNWLIGLAVTGLPILGTTIWAIWRSVVSLLRPPCKIIYDKVLGGIDEHRSLVVAMEANVPVVAKTMATMSETMGKLAETQANQSNAIERLDARHSEHSVKLDAILTTLKGATHAGS
jgi:hypothetical protein